MISTSQVARYENRKQKALANYYSTKYIMTIDFKINTFAVIVLSSFFAGIACGVCTFYIYESNTKDNLYCVQYEDGSENCAEMEELDIVIFNNGHKVQLIDGELSTIYR